MGKHTAAFEDIAHRLLTLESDNRMLKQKVHNLQFQIDLHSRQFRRNERVVKVRFVYDSHIGDSDWDAIDGTREGLKVGDIVALRNRYGAEKAVVTALDAQRNWKQWDGSLSVIQRKVV